jgi:O-antigen/teichoic acid export membrane protein
MLLLGVVATPLAEMFHEPELGLYLRLFAGDILLFNLAQTQQSILIGIGRFRERAFVSAGRSISRVLLIVILVDCGFSVPGAILGSIGASLTELVICRVYIRVPVWQRSDFPIRQLWKLAIPLSLSALSWSFYHRMDLFALKMLGGTAEQAGFYGAAHNIAWLPGIFAGSFASLLLATLGRVLSAGEVGLAKRLGRDAMRAVLLLLPFVGLVGGTAAEIVDVIFHSAFLPAAPLVSILIFGALAMVMISVTTAIVTAAGKPNWAFALNGPLVPLALVGHLLLIPRFGPIGASLVTTLFAGVGALASIVAVYALWRILPPLATFWRSVLLCGCAYALAALWPTPGFLLFVKLAILGLAIVSAFFLLGEFAGDEIALVRSILRPRVLSQQTDPSEASHDTKGRCRR